MRCPDVALSMQSGYIEGGELTGPGAQGPTRDPLGQAGP